MALLGPVLLAVAATRGLAADWPAPWPGAELAATVLATLAAPLGGLVCLGAGFRLPVWKDALPAREELTFECQSVEPTTILCLLAAGVLLIVVGWVATLLRWRPGGAVVLEAAAALGCAADATFAALVPWRSVVAGAQLTRRR